MRSGLALNVLLAFTWALLLGDVTLPQLAVGFVLGFPLLVFSDRLGRAGLGRPAPRNTYTAKAPKLLRFLLTFAWAMVRANLQVARDVLTRHRYAEPGVLKVKLRAETELELTLIANLVTLTPGTLTLDIGHSGGSRVLYVHAMFAGNPERVRREIIDDFETPLLEILR